MGNVELKSRAHSLVDDVVCQGVRYLFELSAFEGGCHATALVRSGRAADPVLGGFYPSMDRMLAQGPADLCRQGVPPAVVSYVKESLSLFMAYR
ncbi:MAG: hypothetical protein M3Z29_08630 [Pseudomonadota bacterium]|nr:hypothetical protein [Pseudomonadota bacterium]